MSEAIQQIPFDYFIVIRFRGAMDEWGVGKKLAVVFGITTIVLGLFVAMIFSGRGDSLSGTTESGIQYEILQEGSGPEIEEGDQIGIHYILKRTNSDEVIENSRDQADEPITLVVGTDESLESWKEIIPLMRVGEIRSFTSPAELAFGVEGYPPQIPPNTDVVFEIEVVELVDTVPEEAETEEVGENDIAVDNQVQAIINTAVMNDNGIYTLESGLQYEIIKEGTGDKVAFGEMIAVHYVGTLEDGSQFDSSRDRGEPFELSAGNDQVIDGWNQGIPGMRVGEIRKLIIPPDLGYGSQEIPGRIPANSTLIFEVEVVEKV